MGLKLELHGQRDGPGGLLRGLRVLNRDLPLDFGRDQILHRLRHDGSIGRQLRLSLHLRIHVGLVSRRERGGNQVVRQP